MDKNNKLAIIGHKKYAQEKVIYEVKASGNKTALIYSSLDAQWAHPNKVAMELENTGNELIITDKLGKRKWSFDYMQAEQIRVLLRLNGPDETFTLLHACLDEKEKK